MELGQGLLRPKNEVLKDHLFHTIQKPLKNIENNTSFTTVKTICQSKYQLKC